jgi:hypothetical protein
MVVRLFVVALAIAATVASLSCGNSGSGMGMGVSAPTRYGGGNGRPPVFVGGPS